MGGLHGGSPWGVGTADACTGNSELSPPPPEQVGPFKQAYPSFPSSRHKQECVLKGFGNPSFNRGIWSGQVPLQMGGGGDEKGTEYCCIFSPN